MPPSQPGATRRRRGASRPPRASFSHLDAPWSTPPPFPPPLQSFLLRLPCSFPSPPENSPEHRSAPAWPSTSRSRTKVSKRFAVVVFIDLQRESKPDASPSPLPPRSQHQ